MPTYSEEKVARKYIDYLNSSNGQVFKRVLFDAIYGRIKDQTDARILDAGCGNGWLTEQLSHTHKNIQGCDGSAALITSAQKAYPSLNFQQADFSSVSPFPAENFDLIILNMVLQDLDQQFKALENLRGMLKNGGKLIVTLSNPYYAYPVGVWKRGFLRFLFRKQPRLKIAGAYNQITNENLKRANWNYGVNSKFQPLASLMNNLLTAGFELKFMEDLRTNSDSRDFNLQHQLYRFPVILLLELGKPITNF